MTALTLETACSQLLNGTLTLESGIIAQLTRQSYIDPYTTIVNYQQFVPILYFNIIENTLQLTSTPAISFSSTDIFTADDWVILNEEVT